VGAKLKHFIWSLLIASGLGLPVAVASAQPFSEANEYEVKALFIFNFLRFVEWPEKGVAPDAPYKVVIAADDEVFAGLASILRTRAVNQRKIEVTRLSKEPASTKPHVLYLTRSAPGWSRAIAKEYQQYPVLLVGEEPGFARRNGIVNFVVNDEIVRLEINVQAAARSSLQISGRLAALATVVKGEP
jgi:hypothetical protein